MLLKFVVISRFLEVLLILCIKYWVWVFDIKSNSNMFQITGVVILTIGAVILSEYGTYEALLDGNYFSTPGLLISIGVFIFIIAFFGCCGSIRENYCMVLTVSIQFFYFFMNTSRTENFISLWFCVLEKKYGVLTPKRKNCQWLVAQFFCVSLSFRCYFVLSSSMLQCKGLNKSGDSVSSAFQSIGWCHLENDFMTCAATD